VAVRFEPTVANLSNVVTRTTRRPLSHSEFNAAAAGAANRKALDEIAAALTRCRAETGAAQANLRALTGQD
jgi:hypothetical protein